MAPGLELKETRDEEIRESCPGYIDAGGRRDRGCFVPGGCPRGGRLRRRPGLLWRLLRWLSRLLPLLRSLLLRRWLLRSGLLWRLLRWPGHRLRIWWRMGPWLSRRLGSWRLAWRWLASPLEANSQKQMKRPRQNRGRFYFD